MAPKCTGTAIIVLGLERVPVRLYPATSESPRVSFTTICRKHGAKVETLQRCLVDQELFEKPEKQGAKPEGLATAYQLGKTSFLALTDEELEEIQPKPDPEIVIAAKAELEELDPLLFTGSFSFLGPDAGSGPVLDVGAQRAYAKLVEGLAEASSGESAIAVGRYATRGTDKLVGIYRKDRRLVMAGLRRAGEIRDITELEPADEAPWNDLANVTAVLSRLHVDKLDTGRFPDDRYNAAVMLLEKKAAQLAEAPRKVPKRARATR
jgi:DNA end-binding protein Ku